VTDPLRELLAGSSSPAAVYAIGPLPMMRAVAEATRPFGVHTLVSLNTIMVDGTGMCGGCRVTVDGKMKFACVDGPEFDGHVVDFDELMLRNRTYADLERLSDERHRCRLQDPAEDSR
jgi:ferredoxin--NADP+ reductase